MTDAAGMNQGWKNADLPFTRVSGPTRYARDAIGTVTYIPVANSSLTLGLLWFSDTSDAAHFVRLASAGSEANNAAAMWVGRLTDAKARGLLPSEAVAEFAGMQSSEDIGALQVAKAEQVESLEDIARLASN